MFKVTMYSDGCALGNPGKAGYGTILMYNDQTKELNKGFEISTNNRMELLGVIVGLEELKQPCDVTVYSDSNYVVKAIEEGWLTNWQKNGWKTAAKKPVKNKDLWKRLIPQLKRHKVNFKWVKGHAGQVYNERCDRLANEAARWPFSKLEKDTNFQS